MVKQRAYKMLIDKKITELRTQNSELRTQNTELKLSCVRQILQTSFFNFLRKLTYSKTRYIFDKKC